ncbi:hypothetical protein ACFY3G_45140 [Streptomyces phaeochromogenes]|uniref:hypothetical protein n=1 Tax=Streptomyces phaeochromogenes TaxID=1923 RepID=UPI0036BE4FF2
MAEAYTPAPPEGGGSDEYRCQVIDPGLTKTAFLTGTQFAPENVAIAHHAVVYAVPPGGAAAVREQAAKTPGLGWQYFGGTGVAGAEVEEGDAAWDALGHRRVDVLEDREQQCSASEWPTNTVRSSKTWLASTFGKKVAMGSSFRSG